jgi:phosphate:Na+ symporter
MARAIQHRKNVKDDFSPTQYDHLHDMLRLVNEAITQMMVVVSRRREDLTIDTSQEIENDINSLRDQLKTESINDAGSADYSYTLNSIYNDIIAECEKLGDYVMNVVEARLGRGSLSYRELQINQARKSVTIDGVDTNLTRTEFDLLSLLLANRGQVLSRQQLMDSIWPDVVVTERTVDVHIARLRKKLGHYARNIVNRQGFGYTFEIN